jgi:hypothetical protein
VVDAAGGPGYAARDEECGMKNWIVMFRPETYAVAQQVGMMAVLHNHRRRFAAVGEGDRFVAYISRQRLLDAHGVVTSDAFEQVSEEPPGWIRYTQRAQVRFEETGAGVDAREVLWGLSVWGDTLKTQPTNMLFCKGGFLEIPDRDYDWLRAVLRGDAPAVAQQDG